MAILLFFPKIQAEETKESGFWEHVWISLEIRVKTGVPAKKKKKKKQNKKKQTKQNKKKTLEIQGSRIAYI